MRVLSWPNALSLLRLPLAAAFMVFESTAVRCGIVIAAGLSDFLDGRLARRYGQRSRSGEILDPITDKTFVFVALVSFIRSGQLAFWELLVLLVRDLYAAAAFITALLLRVRLRFRARWSGKVVTTIQGAAVLLLLLRPEWSGALILVAGVAGVYAIVDYTQAGLRALRRPDDTP